jgi:hypothetical protein
MKTLGKIFILGLFFYGGYMFPEFTWWFDENALPH